MSNDEVAWVSAIAAAVSAIAALVALVAAAFSVWLQWRAGRPRVRVEGVTSTIFYRDGTSEETKYAIDVSNVGLIPVVITGVGVTMRGDEKYGAMLDAVAPNGRQVLPQKLEPGEGTSLVNPMAPVVLADLEHGVTGVYAQTATGKRHVGKNTVKLRSFRPPEQAR